MTVVSRRARVLGEGMLHAPLIYLKRFFFISAWSTATLTQDHLPDMARFNPLGLFWLNVNFFERCSVLPTYPIKRGKMGHAVERPMQLSPSAKRTRGFDLQPNLSLFFAEPLVSISHHLRRGHIAIPKSE